MMDLDGAEVQVVIRERADVAIARIRARTFALHEGMGGTAAEALATAVSEIAHNIAVHAGAGEIAITTVSERGRHGGGGGPGDGARKRAG